MSSSIATLPDDAPIEALETLFADGRVRGIAVVQRDGQPVGFITPREAAIRQAVADSTRHVVVTANRAGFAAPSVRFVRDAMMPFVFRIKVDTPIATAVKLMLLEETTECPVFDHSGSIVGMLSARDVVDVVRALDERRTN